MKEKVQGFWGEIDVNYQVSAIMEIFALCSALLPAPPRFSMDAVEVLAQRQSPMEQFRIVCHVQ